MSDENEVGRSVQVTPHVIVASSENGVDLSDILNILVRWKVTVISVAFMTFVAIVANAFLNTPVPVYKARATLSLTNKSDLKGIPEHEGSITVERVFRVFVQNMKSRDVQLRYFKENNLFNKLVSDRGSNA